MLSTIYYLGATPGSNDAAATCAEKSRAGARAVGPAIPLLYSTLPYPTLPYSTLLYTRLDYTRLYYTRLYYNILYYTTLDYTIIYYNNI